MLLSTPDDSLFSLAYALLFGLMEFHMDFNVCLSMLGECMHDNQAASMSHFPSSTMRFVCVCTFDFVLLLSELTQLDFVPLFSLFHSRCPSVHDFAYFYHAAFPYVECLVFLVH